MRHGALGDRYGFGIGIPARMQLIHPVRVRPTCPNTTRRRPASDDEKPLNAHPHDCVETRMLPALPEAPFCWGYLPAATALANRVSA